MMLILSCGLGVFILLGLAGKWRVERDAKIAKDAETARTAENAQQDYGDQR